jgi:hypothetical protein
MVIIQKVEKAIKNSFIHLFENISIGEIVRLNAFS